MEDTDGMNSLPERIMEYTEAKPIHTSDLLRFGDRPAVVRSLSRLARSERLWARSSIRTEVARPTGLA